MNGQGTKSAWWLGGNDMYSEGEWNWNSGQQFSFTNWHEGEPNNSGQEVGEMIYYNKLLSNNDNRLHGCVELDIFQYITL